MADHSKVHQRLLVAARFAEVDERFHQQLKDSPVEALERFGVSADDLRQVFDDDDPGPGCADGTCWVSLCPETCYVTICSPSAFEENIREQVETPLTNALREIGVQRRGGR